MNHVSAAEVESVWSELSASANAEHEELTTTDKCELCVFHQMIGADPQLAWAMSGPTSSVMITVIPPEALRELMHDQVWVHTFTKSLECMILLGLKIGRKQGMAEMFEDMKKVNQGR